MAQTPLDAVVRHIRKLVNPSAISDLADAQLLQRFARHREEAAFAALVERHGRLVWSACWRVLQHEHDAEDAFQATFLVLARQAASIRAGATVASWLYRVAHRVAVKARNARAKQHTQERQAATMPRGKPSSELAWRELQAVLVEELECLAEKYRAPFLLCCLEGKSKAEAARELGWKEGTVSSRLAHARKQLQQRLSRRGMVLTAALCASALSPEVTASAAPAALLGATTRAAVLFAAGKGAAVGAVSGHALGLAEAVLKTMAMTKVKVATALLLAVSALGGGAGLLAHRAAADNPADAPRQGANRRADPAAAAMTHPGAGGRPKPAARPKPADRVAVTGRVLDVDGKPIAGARVAVAASRKLRYEPAEMMSSLTYLGLTEETEVLGQAQADPTGAYRVMVPADTFKDYHSAVVLAAGPGYGLGWQAIGSGKDNAATVVRLRRESAIRCRLIDLQGQPAAGVNVSLVRLGTKSYPARRQYTFDADRIEPAPIFYQRFIDLGGMMTKSAGEPQVDSIQFDEPPAGLPSWPRLAVTDRQGRFVLHGLAGDQACAIQVRDDRFAAQTLDLRPPAQDKTREVTLALGPPHVLEGTVTDADGGRPVPHAHLHIDTFPDYFGGLSTVIDFGDDRGRRLSDNYYVSMGSPISRMDAAADDKGRFRLNPFLGNTLIVTVTGPAGEPYLAVRKNVNWPKGTVKQELNVTLPRGVLVRGQVRDDSSGKPSAGTRIDFWPKALKPREGRFRPFDPKPAGWMYARHTRTGPDGKFQAVLPTGSWHLLLNGPRHDYLGHTIAVERVAEDPAKNQGAIVPGNDPREKQFYRPDAWTALELKPGHKVKDLSFRLRRLAVKGRLIDPDGKPVAGAKLLYQRNPDWRIPEVEASRGRFEFPIRDPDRTYHVLFLDADHGLGAVTELSAKQAGREPVVVRLDRCGSATARFVDAHGKPLANYRPLLWALLPPGPHGSDNDRDLENLIAAGLHTDAVAWAARADPRHYGDGPRTDAAGRVTLPALVPGATYRVSLFGGRRRDFTAKAGQAVNLGDVVIKDASKTNKLPVVKPPG